MRRPILGALAAVATAGAAAAPAGAQVIELGLPTKSSELVAPTCPAGTSDASCRIILTQVTALETIRDGVAYPTTVKRSGSIVAFTVGLSRLNSNDAKALAAIRYLDRRYGGTARAAITVLSPVGRKRDRRWRVSAESEVIHLQPYLGQVVQFPLQAPLRVKPGDVVALTTPTWAPVLSFALPTGRYAYRQSRSRNCENPAASTQAQSSVGDSARYLCNYPGARVEYSATEVTDPTPDRRQLR